MSSFGGVYWLYIDFHRKCFSLIIQRVIDNGISRHSMDNQPPKKGTFDENRHRFAHSAYFFCCIYSNDVADMHMKSCFGTTVQRLD
jgi:hypothetical protein